MTLPPRGCRLLSRPRRTATPGAPLIQVSSRRFFSSSSRCYFSAAFFGGRFRKLIIPPCDERLSSHPSIGTKTGEPDINTVHRLMNLYDGGDRKALLRFIADCCSRSDAGVWRVLISLAEILPPGTADHRRAAGLLANKQSLLHDVGHLDESLFATNLAEAVGVPDFDRANVAVFTNSTNDPTQGRAEDGATIRTLWKRQDSLTGANALIHTSDVNFQTLEALAGQLKKLYGNGYEAVIAADVAGNASNAFKIDSVNGALDALEGPA